MSASELQMNRSAFLQWVVSETGDNTQEMQHCKKAVSVALYECVTEIQRTYIIHYYVDSMTVEQIANMYGRNKSTVSRTIKAGMEKMFKHLKFTSPRFLNVSEFPGRLRRKG